MDAGQANYESSRDEPLIKAQKDGTHHGSQESEN